jgi:hypothetical protein
MLCFLRYLRFIEPTASILRVGSSILKMVGTGSSKMLEPTHPNYARHHVPELILTTTRTVSLTKITVPYIKLRNNGNCNKDNVKFIGSFFCQKS